ncbi:MAG: chemotaxis protein CheE [Pseudomonadota bacterium]|nr:chemotaxis protein CheE [Pseudomonadota bacterium]
MTVITHARRKSRLATMIDSAGGITVGAALSRARANVAALRPRGLAEVARHIGELGDVAPSADPGSRIETLHRIYRAANDLIDAAAPFDLDEICAVAVSLCDVVDRVAKEAELDWRIIEVHVQALRLLNTLPPEATAERTEITGQLARMVARKFG